MTTTHATLTAARESSLPPGPQISVWENLKGILSLFSKSPDFIGQADEMFETYGDIVDMQVANRHIVLLRHPDHIHEVAVRQAEHFEKGRDYTDDNVGLASFLGGGLLTSNGETWRRQRKLVQPALHPTRIAAYADDMVTATQTMLDRWQTGTEFQLEQEMSALTLQIVAKCLFNKDVTKDVQQIVDAMFFLQRDTVSPWLLLPKWIPTPFRRRRARLRTELDRIVYRFIHEWRQEATDRGDLLSVLLLATDEEGDNMSDLQVRDELITLLLAGHETTANALNWTFHLLSHNPQAEATLHKELDRVLAGRPPGLADLKQLPYSRAVIDESMRLYPPAWTFSRQATDTVEIGGYQLPPGSDFHIYTYQAHRDPRWWKESEAFQPERFLQEDPNRPRYAYIPFGAGPRICVGNHFALMEAQLTLVTIAQRFRLRSVQDRVETEQFITLLPKGGLRVRVEGRGG